MTNPLGLGGPAGEVNALMRALGGRDIPGLEQLDPSSLRKLRDGLKTFVDEIERSARGQGSLSDVVNGNAQQYMQQAARMASQGCASGGCGSSGGFNPLSQNCCGGGSSRSALGLGSGNPELDAMAELGGGSMYFEDKVFAIMCKVVKDMQKQIEEKLNKLQAAAKQAESQGGGGGGGGGGVMGGGGGGGGNDGSESRNIEFEKIKMDIQKLSQMQQAMSNVLNTFDELAKSAIRHIKAG
jgi:hypothetical protein